MCLLQERQPIYCESDRCTLGRPAAGDAHRISSVASTRVPPHGQSSPASQYTRKRIYLSRFPFGELEPLDAPIGSIVIYRQHTHTVQVLRRMIEIPSAVGLFFEFHREPKGRALTRLTLHTYLTVHQPCQLFSNRQAQASASIITGRRPVSLAKRFKEVPLTFRGNAYAAVFHPKMQPSRRGRFAL